MPKTSFAIELSFQGTLAPKRPGDRLGASNVVGRVGIRMVVRILALENRIARSFPIVGIDRGGVPLGGVFPRSLGTPDLDRIFAIIAGPLMLGGQHPRTIERRPLRRLHPTGHAPSR